ncbi:hypothetical protein BJX70DRAFT_385044 [Aspergillus crustosus]
MTVAGTMEMTIVPVYRNMLVHDIKAAHAPPIQIQILALSSCQFLSSHSLLSQDFQSHLLEHQILKSRALQPHSPSALSVKDLMGGARAEVLLVAPVVRSARVMVNNRHAVTRPAMEAMRASALRYEDLYTCPPKVHRSESNIGAIPGLCVFKSVPGRERHSALQRRQLWRRDG